MAKLPLRPSSANFTQQIITKIQAFFTQQNQNHKGRSFKLLARDNIPKLTRKMKQKTIGVLGEGHNQSNKERIGCLYIGMNLYVVG